MSRTRRLLLALAVLVGLVAVSAISASLYVRHKLTLSLPQLEGTRVLPELESPVTVTRDSLGIPTIAAATRRDAARALGFVHAQDRYFQMDLQRRQAAGELAALVGPRAIALDRTERIHRFRDVARRALALTAPVHRAVLDAYAEGVNAGLHALDAPPFEYLLLGTTPEPWAPEDTFLTVLAMFNNLQGRQAGFELTTGTLYALLPEPLAAYLTARGSAWDTLVVGGPLPRPPIPGPEVVDLRKRTVQTTKDTKGTNGTTATEAQRHGARKRGTRTRKDGDATGTTAQPLLPKAVQGPLATANTTTTTATATETQRHGARKHGIRTRKHGARTDGAPHSLLADRRSLRRRLVSLGRSGQGSSPGPPTVHGRLAAADTKTTTATETQSHGARKHGARKPGIRTRKRGTETWKRRDTASASTQSPLAEGRGAAVHASPDRSPRSPDRFDRSSDRNIPSRDHQIKTSQDSGAIPLCVSVSRWPVCDLSGEEAAGIGSNNWAVSGDHTATGAALVANDMHLQLGVPNIWYRATMTLPDETAPDGVRRLSGITLPGLPNLVVGSNGEIAWGFTNSGGDWSDLVIVEPDPRDPDRYLTPDGPRAFDEYDETIDVKGAEPVILQVRWTIWGPIVADDAMGRLLAQRWVAHDADRLASDTTRPEGVESTAEAIATGFPGLGIPAQNVVVGDRAGNIGWTIAGPIPRRVGHDGSRPVSWADGTNRWDGYLDQDETPRIMNPPEGRIWTANAPVVDGEALRTLGEGGYADGIRARIIRDRLMSIEHATPADMLQVQLDDTALYHDRWRRRLLDVLTPAVVQADPRRAELRRLVETTWTGRASPESVAYPLVRTFRAFVSRRVFGAILAPVERAVPRFDYDRALRSEGPLWPIVTTRPTHLVPPGVRDWQALFVAAVDETIGVTTEDGRPLADHAWGDYNRAAIAHPLASALGIFGHRLNMPVVPLPGDVYTPRAQSPRTGASERMVVSPGHEESGILHMPAGQSGHPLSPHYRDQHEAWMTGEPLPFLPGPAVSTLTLVPSS